jgi:cytochrome c oxidase cbb3-type subunit 2
MTKMRFGWLLLPWLALTACGAPQDMATDTQATDAPAIVAEPAVRTDGSNSLDYPRWKTYNPGEHQTYNHRTNLIQRGREVYATYCVGCHGVYGDGRGPATERLITRPRDFTSGIYKFRTTDSGSLPMESDMYRTITLGLPGVSMPGFPLMPHRDKVSVIEYVKSFYPDWDADAPERVRIQVPLPPSDLFDPRRELRGRGVYAAMQCGQCHGSDGKGTGATRTEYVDAWGDSQKPFNFTRGALKGGNLPEDIYRTFHTGLRSIMPSYGGDTLGSITREGVESLVDEPTLAAIESILDDFPADFEAMDELDRARFTTLVERNSWDLVAYILSLKESTSTAAAVLGSAP